MLARWLSQCLDGAGFARARSASAAAPGPSAEEGAAAAATEHPGTASGGTSSTSLRPVGRRSQSERRRGTSLQTFFLSAAGGAPGDAPAAASRRAPPPSARSKSPLSSIELRVESDEARHGAAAGQGAAAAQRREANLGLAEGNGGDAAGLLVEAKVTGAAQVTERAPLAGLSKRLSRHWAPDRRTADDVAAYERAKRRAKAVVLQLRSYRRQASSKVRQAGKRASRRLRENITALSESLEGDHNVVMEREEAVSSASEGEGEGDDTASEDSFEDAGTDFTSEVGSEGGGSDVSAAAATAGAAGTVANSDVAALHVSFEERSSSQRTDASSEHIVPSSSWDNLQNCVLPALPPGLSNRYWGSPGAAGLRVRGHTYLRDKRKVPAQAPLFDLMRVDLFSTPASDMAFHIARRLRTIEWGAPGTLNTVIVNMMIPGPGAYERLAMVAYFSPTEKTARMLSEGDTSHPFTSLLATFLAAEPEVKNGVFKMIPKISEGSWLTKKAVGETPVIIGRKLETVYHRGPGYLEIDVDVSSDPIARRITGMCIGVVSTLVVDLAFLFEGHSEDELPEALLGTVSIRHLLVNADTVRPLAEVEARLRTNAARSGGSADSQ